MSSCKKNLQLRRRVARQLVVESLETRTLLAADLPLMQSTVDPMDVNDDGAVVPNDALMIVSRSNRADQARNAAGFLGVNDDRQLSAMDALLAIDRLNHPRRGDQSRGYRPGAVNDGSGDEEYSIDGTGNNLENPEWGSTDEQLLRLTTVEYADGISQPGGDDRPSAREISNAVAAQTTTEANDRLLTDIAWLWGQFIDHDIDLTENSDPAESYYIDVPAGDSYFDPGGSGHGVIVLNRSDYDHDTGTSTENPRQQINQITAFLDGSVIYGSDGERAAQLRFDGGMLETSEGDLLPFNEAGLANAGGTSTSLFLAGDVRANENAALTAMHTLWVREHNHWAEQVAAEDPSLNDEEIFQQARRIVTAELQAITYNEFLPALLGYDVIDAYAGYDHSVNPGIANVFSTAAYRFGHSMLSSELLRLNNDGTTADEGNLSLQSAFFAPHEITENGIDSVLLGATAQIANEIDTQVVDDVRNFLFGAPGSGGFDLASLNIQRGRDHGLADYNQTRVDVGLDPVESFSDITSDPELTATLEALYGDVNNIDVWVGGLAEDRVAGSSLGELFTTIIADQFQRIRDGDSNWYQKVFAGRELRQIEETTLSDVIRRNTEITELRGNVFYDESVLYFSADSRRPVDVAVVVAEGRVDLVNRRSAELLDSRSLDEVSKIHLVGSDRPGDRFTIDLRRADSTVVDDVIIHGGHDARNFIEVLGTPDGDAITVDGNQFNVNGTTIEYSNIRLLRWVPGSGGDRIDVVSESEARFVVDDDGPRSRRPGRLRLRPNMTPQTETLAESERNSRRLRAAAFDDVFTQLGELPPDDLLNSLSTI